MPPLKSKLKKCGGKKCRQNAKVGAESAVKIVKCRQKVPPLKSEEKSHGGGMCHQNGKVVAECAIKMEKWWRKMLLKQQSDGKKCHHFTTLVELQPSYQ